MAKRAVRPRILAMWIVVLAAAIATPTAAAADQSAAGGANRWFWAVVGIVVTLTVGVWLLTLLIVIFGSSILWIREHVARHHAEHPARITIDPNLPH